MLQYLVLFSLPLAVYGIGTYLKNTITGRVKPNKVSWLMWSVAPLIATFAALSKGVTWAVLPVFMSGFVSFLTFLASFVNPKAYWKLNKNDYICGLLSILALVLWGITSDANIAIIFSILSDLAATLPTITKAWKHPKSESGSAFIGGFLNALSTFFVVKSLAFTEIGFVSYNVLINLVILYSIYNRKLRK